MVAIFFMKSGLIKSVTLESGKTVNASWYVDHCWPEVLTAVSERRPNSRIRGLILHDDNARPSGTWVTDSFLCENHVESYPNLQYSPDLSPCDFFLFPKLKSQLRGVRFRGDNEMLHAWDQAIDSLTENDFKNCFADWFNRMKKCTNAQGRYFKNK